MKRPRCGAIATRFAKFLVVGAVFPLSEEQPVRASAQAAARAALVLVAITSLLSLQGAPGLLPTVSLLPKGAPVCGETTPR
jgi:hypothetical protein